MKQLTRASRHTRNNQVDFAFNRGSVFSPEECDGLIRWAEAKDVAGLPRTDYQEGLLEGAAFARRHRQLTVKTAVRDVAVMRFQRKLRQWTTELNSKIWRFDVTRFSELLLIRYGAGDAVGTHMDLGTEYCDRKLAALVQLSPADTYTGGVLRFGLADTEAYPVQGSLLVFPSWVLHRVEPITAGVRYTAVCFALGPSFR